MIALTRLNNRTVMVNSDLIKFVEQAPDTVITLVSGEKMLVLENSAEILDRVIDFRRLVLQGLVPAWDSSARSGSSSAEGEAQCGERVGR
jgi:flagellar protein FlbD